MRNPTCPYCQGESVLVSGKAIYPHRGDLHNRSFYLCDPCTAYVGCHPNSTSPLGRLADKELRRAKAAAHSAFDPLWRSGKFSRRGAYKWLGITLGIESKKCHIGMFDVEGCKKVETVCMQYEFESTT